MLVFPHDHVNLCWSPLLVIYTCVCIRNWSYIPVLIFSLSYVSPCCYSHFSCVPMLIFSLGHVSLCWYTHLIRCLCVDSHTYLCILVLMFSIWSCVPVLISCILLFSFGHMYLCCYSPLCHVSLCWYSYLVMLVFTLFHVSLYWYSHLVMYCSVALLTWSHVPWCYWPLVMNICVDRHT